MKIRTRLTIWYAIVLVISLSLISIGAFRELKEQFLQEHQPQSSTLAFDEAVELLLQIGLPAVILGLFGGWWLTRRMLNPLSALTEAAQLINERNLGEQLPRTGNGDELDRLTEVLNATTARLNDSFTRVREFTLHASHELKTPLTILCGEIETALHNESLTPAQRERAGSQLEELRRLTAIVDGLTLLAKADAGLVPLSLAPMRFDDVTRDSFADAQILAQESGLRVELAACEETFVRGDKHRLRQMLLNLADNAVKYNRPGGTVSMALQHVNGSAELTIANTGPGISPERLPRVFDRFFRGDPSHSSSVEGCGLGLSIAQWIVSAHGGTIEIKSDPLKLTTVKVCLPLVVTHQPVALLAG
jgi:signal transduction histidine kinase